MEKELIRKSRKIALALRHKPEEFDLSLDNEGWCNLKDFLKNLNISRKDLDAILENCNKNRYSLNKAKTKIRANQGHSTDVDIKFQEVTDIPEILYHGTKREFLKSILRDGLCPGVRQYVHLSGDYETAQNVANRRKGESVYLKIEKDAFLEQKLYISENGVYLTKHIPAKYLRILDQFSKDIK